MAKRTGRVSPAAKKSAVSSAFTQKSSKVVRIPPAHRSSGTKKG